MKILVTGGAGYIGSHIVSELVDNGHQVSVLDNLSNGQVDRLNLESVQFFLGDIGNTSDLEKSLIDQDLVIHLAALKSVNESTRKPDLYLDCNGRVMFKILHAMKKKSVKKLVFASSGAVYADNQNSQLLSESSMILPTSPYGLSKFLGEEILKSLGTSLGISTCALRFFNVIGASNKSFTDRSKENLLPKMLEVIKKGGIPKIYGKDYPTEDGTAIRDYVDVRDVANAHIQIISTLDKPGFTAFNVGTGIGTSVLRFVHELKKISRIDFNWEFDSRRTGDPSYLVASNTKIVSQTYWKPRYSFADSIHSVCQYL
jgi:UDP-glucose 4-epimerase